MTKIFTIGHSTRTIEEFISLLRVNGISQLVDIRTIPRSRHNPQFEQDALRDSLQAAGIRYLHLKSLGGLRPSQTDSVNAAWRNKSFRNFADYMQTDEFGHGLAELVRLGSQQTTAIMCAEAVPWRCHRSLVGDALLAQGVDVLDIISAASPKPHVMTPFAVVAGERLTYPATGPDDHGDAVAESRRS